MPNCHREIIVVTIGFYLRLFPCQQICKNKCGQVDLRKKLSLIDISFQLQKDTTVTRAVLK